MTPERWQKLQEVVAAAVDLPRTEQDRFLEAFCEGDNGLLEEARRMVAAYSTTDQSMQAAIGEATAQMAFSTEYVQGDRLGPYRVCEQIGHGGMGVVYRAERSDDQFRQAVAIKVVLTGFGTRQELLARFRLERQVLANITHPNIARLLDGGITPTGLPYLVMEYIEGVNIVEYAQRERLSVAATLKLFCQLCAAVQHAHRNLVVHRDLKPGNVLVTSAGEAKLLDFGIAKLLAPQFSGQTIVHTVAAERLMTPEYASPEQVRGEAITTATDIYGLGVLLYELLTGVRPYRFATTTLSEAERVLRETSAVAPSLVKESVGPHTTTRRAGHKHTDLDRIVLKALHKSPERRYGSAADFAADIERYLAGFPVVARPDSVGYRTGKFVERHRWAVGAAVLFLLTVVGLSILLAAQARRARHEAASAEAVSQFLVGLFNNAQPDATRGRTTDARQLLDAGTAQLNAQWTGEPLVKARLLSTLGSVYYQLGVFDRAEALFREAKDTYTRVNGADSPEVADVSNSLGEAELDKGDYAESLRDYSDAVRIFEQIRPQSAELADAMDGLSGILWEMGRYKESERYHLRSIAMATRILGPTARMTMVDKNNLAVLLVDMGRYREAAALNREVLAARLKQFGEDNSHTASSMCNLAVDLYHLGELAEAKALLERSLAIRRKIYPPGHPNIAKCLVYLSELYRDAGDLPTALRYGQEALSIARQSQTENSIDTAFDEDNLGTISLLQGNTRAARDWAQRALQTRLAQRANSVPLLSQSYDQLGTIDLADGHLAAAQANVERGLQMRTAFPDGAKDQIAQSYLHRCQVRLALGNTVGEQDDCLKALSIAKESFGDKPHLLTASVLDGLAAVQQAGHQPGAGQRLAEAKAMRLAVLAPLKASRNGNAPPQK